MTTANAAIDFAPEGYTTGGSRLMGRQAAGEGFLRAWMRHAQVPALLCHSLRKPNAEAFAQLRDAHAGREIPVRWILPEDSNALAEAGTLYVPDPGIPRPAWRRLRLGAAHRYSLCGITHTIASHNAMDGIASYLSAPVEPWDALICTSRAVLASVRRLQEAELEWLARRLGASAPALPQLALIPLGVECDALAPDAAQRAAWRAKLGIGEADVVFLFVGRLSFHAKANPAPMYAALEQAARASGRRLHLLQAGWFANDGIRRAFEEGAKAFCPSVSVRFLDGRDKEVRSGIRHAADVFISLSDNVQETFGLTPVEAMAAGLPGVVSDWDGYRDTVRDGIDGYCAPTVAPPAGAGAELAARHDDNVDNYDFYIGHASLATSVDPQACAAACTALATDAGLRRRMGEAALARARAEFDWPVVLRRYQDLWRELAARRALAQPAPAGVSVNPRRRDPFWLFAEYPTHTLAGNDRLALAPGADGARLRAALASELYSYGREMLPAPAEFGRMLEQAAAADGCRVDDLLPAPGSAGRARMQRGVGWMLKAGLLRLLSP